MPISIRLLIFGPPDFAISLKMRLKPRAAARAGGIETAKLRRGLSDRLPPHLVRDVLPD
jgi:hypothetical protein